MKHWLFAVILGVLLVGCGSVKKIESGKQNVGERMYANIDGAWNHIDFPTIKPATVWSMEGVLVDELLIYASIKDGQTMHAANAQQKSFVFRSSMQQEDVVAMFEGVLTRDGSTFRLVRLEPFPFGGKKGYRFEFERVRKGDNVQQLGVGYGAMDRGELFALIYYAPRLTFFPRHLARVEGIARSVRIE